MEQAFVRATKLSPLLKSNMTTALRAVGAEGQGELVRSPWWETEACRSLVTPFLTQRVHDQHRMVQGHTVFRTLRSSGYVIYVYKLNDVVVAPVPHTKALMELCSETEVYTAEITPRSVWLKPLSPSAWDRVREEMLTQRCNEQLLQGLDVTASTRVNMLKELVECDEWHEAYQYEKHGDLVVLGIYQMTPADNVYHFKLHTFSKIARQFMAENVNDLHTFMR